jgi:copper chaperone
MSYVKLKVEGMSCNHCVISIEGALNEIGSKGEIDLANGTVSVEYDENKLSLD